MHDLLILSINMRGYRKRIADLLLERKLESKGAILVEGAKWCGKTTTAEQKAKSVLYLADPDKIKQNLQLADTMPSALLNGKTPRLIDEWQLAPNLWDAVRFEVDHMEGVGHFILTGSAVPVHTDEIRHTGTGRITWLTMRTMTLFESGESNGTVSLEQLFGTPAQIFAENKLQLEDIAYLICRGGWPGAVTMKNRQGALEQASDYLEAIVRSDISRVDGTLRNPERSRRILRSYARHQGGQVPLGVLKADLADNEGDSITTDTISSYISALRKIFVVEDATSWNPNLRSKAAIRTADTRYFSDPSIAAAALELGVADLINDLKTMGLLFETMAVRDLRVYADALTGRVYHYRDSNGLECDAVVHLRGGKYGLVEIKLGGDKLVEEGAKNLLKFNSVLDTTKMREPSFLMVLTAVGPYAYRRKDGVYVVPIGCLKH